MITYTPEQVLENIKAIAECREEDIKELPKEEIKEKNWDTRICIYCQREIGTEKKRYANGKLFHKKCFKKAQSNYINGKPINAQ